MTTEHPTVLFLGDSITEQVPGTMAPGERTSNQASAATPPTGCSRDSTP